MGIDSVENSKNDNKGVDILVPHALEENSFSLNRGEETTFPHIPPQQLKNSVHSSLAHFIVLHKC